MRKAIASSVLVALTVLSWHREPVFAQAPSYLTSDLIAVAGPPDATGGCGGTDSYVLNVIGGTISRTGDAAFNNWAVGYKCWGFDEQYVRVYIVADDPVTFDHWESPSGHLYLLDGHNGTSDLTIETSFNILGQSPTFEAVHEGGAPTSDLMTLNRTTAAATTVGPLSGGASTVYPAIAIHPTTKVMYVGGGEGAAVLHTVDPATGALTALGPAGSGITRIGAMGFRGDGVLFAAVKAGTYGAPGANYLATIDPVTGTAALIGSFGSCGVNCSIEGMEAIAFDSEDILYGALHERAQTGTPGLYTISSSTGKASFVAPILDGALDPASGGITSLQFVDGALYGGTAISKTPPGDGGWLVRINKSTGLFWKLGTTSATGGRGIIALAGFGFHCDLQADVPADECEGLVALFDSTDGVHWSTRSGWKWTNSLCSWYGVTCQTGHVTSLDLDWNGLAGVIPESIINLSELTRLSAYISGFTSPTLERLSGLPNLTYLDLGSNSLTGPIPGSIGNLSNLTYLNLNYNDLEGSIPESIGNLSNLATFDIIENELTGSIPESIGSLVNLTHLSLDANHLSGPIPESIGNLAGLTSFSASNNDLSGPIPQSLVGLSNLGGLSLFSNHLSGSLPEAIGNLTSLGSLYFDDNELTGPIPESIGNLTNLTGLFLRENQLTGTIPESIGNLINLDHLFLSGNDLTGPIPPSFGNLTKLSSVDLSLNNLEGTVPLPAAAAMSVVPWGCDASNNEGLCVPDIPAYQILAPGGSICGLPLDPICPPIVHAEAKVFLEGPYSLGAMQARPAFTDHCPSQQPYSSPEFDGTPLDYDHPVVVLSPPDSVMDWVLVSLREDVTPESEVAASERTAFLKTNGSIVDTSGTILAFPGVAPGAYRLVVRHRNHASVMSADTLDLSDGFGSWDFTTAMTQAYSASGAPMKQLRDGRFGMFACDANVDGQITAPDFNLWIAKTTAGATGYEQADCNLDGQVTAPDFNLWIANTTAGAASQVPD